MIVNKKGKYKLLKDYSVRLTNGIYGLSAGIIINITQIDRGGHKVIGFPLIRDWVNWDMPVEPVEEDNNV